MRYELYSYYERYGAYCYHFEMESDTYDDLLMFVMSISIPELISGKEIDKRRFIYLDNEPEEYNILDLGYGTTPTQRECRERICECKLHKYLALWDRTYVESGDFEADKERYERLVAEAVEEGKALSEKFFAFPPIIRIDKSFEAKKPRRKRGLSLKRLFLK